MKGQNVLTIQTVKLMQTDINLLSGSDNGQHFSGRYSLVLNFVGGFLEPKYIVM